MGTTKSWRLDGSDDFFLPFRFFFWLSDFLFQLQHGGNLQGSSRITPLICMYIYVYRLTMHHSDMSVESGNQN